MRNLLALIGLVILGFAAIGWYCGWYTLSVSKGTEGKPEIKTTLDTNKVTSDSSAFFQRMGELVKEKVKANEKQDPPDEKPVNTPGPVVPEKTGQGSGLFSPSKPGSGSSGSGKH